MKLHKSTILRLPFPPTMNTYWRHTWLHGRMAVLISRRGREYRDQVIRAARGDGEPLAGRLRVTVFAWVPDARKRDLDNLLKPLLDACTHAGVWVDDSQIIDLRIVRRGVLADGAIVLRVQVVGEVQRGLFGEGQPICVGKNRGPGIITARR